MLHRRLALPLVAFTFVGLAATGCAEQAAAIRVGDDTVSQSDFDAELDAFASDDRLLALLPPVQENQPFPADAVTGELRGGYNMDFVQFVLQNRILSLLREDLFEDEGFAIPEEQRTALRDELLTGLREADIDVGDIPDTFLDQVVEDAIVRGTLDEAIPGDEQNARLLDLASRTDIEVSSHLGSWDLDRLDDDEPILQPPVAPQSAPDAVATSG